MIHDISIQSRGKIFKGSKQGILKEKQLRMAKYGVIKSLLELMEWAVGVAVVKEKGDFREKVDLKKEDQEAITTTMHDNSSSQKQLDSFALTRPSHPEFPSCRSPHDELSTWIARESIINTKAEIIIEDCPTSPSNVDDENYLSDTGPLDGHIMHIEFNEDPYDADSYENPKEEVKFITLSKEEETLEEEEQALEEEMLKSDLQNIQIGKDDSTSNEVQKHSIINDSEDEEQLESIVMLEEDGSAKVLIAGEHTTLKPPESSSKEKNDI